MAENEDSPKKKASFLPLLLGVVLAVVGGGAGYFFLFDMIAPEQPSETVEAKPTADALLGDVNSSVSFVPVGPIVISLGHGAHSDHLRFAANLEVPSSAKSDVEHMLPRVVDVLNSFLQAVDEADVDSRDGLIRLRTLMLHRVRLVLGEDRVTDLLVSEFVLN